MREKYVDSVRAAGKNYKIVRDSGNLEQIFEGLIKPAIFSMIVQKEACGKKQLNISAQKEPFILNEQTKDMVVKMLQDEGFRVTLQGISFSMFVRIRWS